MERVEWVDLAALGVGHGVPRPYFLISVLKSSSSSCSSSLPTCLPKCPEGWLQRVQESAKAGDREEV